MDKLKNITLKIFTPDGILYDDEVESVTLPSSKGPFTVLINHAPIISSLIKGRIEYKVDEDNSSMIDVESGFVEVKENVVTVCLETVIK